MSLAIPLPHASSLALTIDAICRETDARVAAGDLTVSADDLIGGPGEVRDWLAGLIQAIIAVGNDQLVLTPGEPAALQPVVYTLSAIMVWAAEMYSEGRSAIVIPQDALAAWEVVEEAAGLAGRTASAIGAPIARRPLRSEMVWIQPDDMRTADRTAA